MDIVSKSGGNEFQGDAKAISMDKEGGSFEVCKKADVTAVDLNNPYLTPTRYPITSFVLYGSSRDTDNVLVDGRFLKRDGQLATIDMAEILNTAQNPKNTSSINSLRNTRDRRANGKAKSPTGYSYTT